MISSYWSQSRQLPNTQVQPDFPPNSRVGNRLETQERAVFCVWRVCWQNSFLFREVSLHSIQILNWLLQAHHIMKGNLLYSKSTNLNVNLIQYLHRNNQNIWWNIWTPWCNQADTLYYDRCFITTILKPNTHYLWGLPEPQIQQIKQQKCIISIFVNWGLGLGSHKAKIKILAGLHSL